MSFLDNIKSVASNIQKSTADLASNISSIIKEQELLNTLKKDLHSVKNEIDCLYREIGEEYVNSLTKPEAKESLGTMISILEDKIIAENDLREIIIEAEKELNEIKVAYEKQKSVDEFLKQKDKLDKAISLGIINNDEYNEKIKIHQNKLDYFDEIQRIEQQYSIGIISLTEKIEKIEKLLNA